LEELQVELDRTSFFEKASDSMKTLTRDLLVLDIMGVKDFDLLKVGFCRQNSGYYADCSFSHP
jgi:hypothetical protein